MINFYNERLVPRKLCELLSEVVPAKYHRPVVFSYGKRHMPEGHERVAGVASDCRVSLNLEQIRFDALIRENIGSFSARTWRKMLYVGFHEFGHITLGHCRADALIGQRYRHDRDFRRYWENQANRQADSWMQAVLANNDRLYQPNSLGVIDIVARRRWSRFSSKPMHWSARKDYRCSVTGGQLSIGDVFNSVFAESYSLKHGRTYALIHRIGDGLARVYKDSYGRLHHFWVWGDISIIAARLRNFFDGLTDAEIEGFYQPDEPAVPDDRIRDGQVTAPFSLRARLEALRQRGN